MSQYSCYPTNPYYHPPYANIIPPYAYNVNNDQLITETGSEELEGPIDPSIKTNYKGKVLYKISDGDCDSIHKQHNYGKVINEKFIEEKIPGYVNYPFNTQSSDIIDNVQMKINNTILTIQEGNIISNKPVMLEIHNRKLMIWTTDITERRRLTTKGSSVIDGYKMLDFNGKKVNIDNKNDAQTQ